MSAHFTYDTLLSVQRKHHPFVDMVDSMKDGRFTFSAKDNLCAEGFQARAGSAILDGYRPPFDATPIKRLRASGGLLLGKTAMDEFGFGTFSTNSAHGIPLNPFDVTRSCGGSSGGAGAAACLLPGHLAIGVSTGGSISTPASFCGVTGLTPTYGRVSRYGLIDYSNSLDKVGLLARSVSLIKEHLPTIAGPDPKDPTSCAQPQLPGKGSMPGSLAVPKEVMENLEPSVRKAFDGAVERFKGMGVSVTEVSMPSLRFAFRPITYWRHQRHLRTWPGSPACASAAGRTSSISISMISSPAYALTASVTRPSAVYCWARSAAWSASAAGII